MIKNDELYRGRIDQVNEAKRTSVRIFVSSTFTDTVEERDLLIGYVYPVLRQYCLETYNVQFQYADMRWGIQAQADYDHSTEELCFQELDRCCQYSLATNCVILLSHRYGTRMVPAQIGKEIFQAIEKVLSEDERILINEVYQLDENPIDAIYLLRPIDPAKRDEWDTKQKQLQKLLRRASDLCYQNKTMSEIDRNEFHISVTAKEIYRALKHNEHQSERMIVFFREIEDIDMLDLTIKKKFIDSNNEAQNLSDQTKMDIRNALSQQNIYTYSVKWNDSANKAKYMDTFKNDFIQALKRQIDYHLCQRKSNNVLFDEVLEHAIQCKRLQKQYFPRFDIMEQIKRYVLSDDNEQPCTIYGETGTGKSSLMAQVAIQASSWFSKQEAVAVLIRFLGATPSTCDIRRPLISIIEQICVIYPELQLPKIDPSTTMENIKLELEKLLKKIPTDQNLILLLDSIDQLQPEDYDCSKWLPTTYPSNVKCILSTISVISVEQKQYLILNGITSVVGNRNLIEVLQFEENLAKEVFNFWLDQDRRRLTPIQWKWILPKLSTRRKEPTPLFLSLLYHLTLVWHSFDKEVDPNFIKIETTVETIEYLYSRLAQKHGEILFRRALSYLWSSGGLNEIELEDILTADNEVLQTVFAHYLPPSNIFRLPSTLWIRIRNDISKYLVEKEVDNTTVIYFYHRSFQNHAPSTDIRKKYDFVRQVYFAGDVGGYPNLNDQLFPLASAKLAKKYGFALNNDNQCLIKVDRHLTPQQPYLKYIRGQGRVYNQRRVNQLIKNILWTTTWDFGFLFDYQFISSYFHLYKMKHHLLECYVHSPELRFLLLQLNAASVILDHHPDNVAFEILQRLLPIVDVLPMRTYTLLQQCQKRCAIYPLNGKISSTMKYTLDTILDMQVSSHIVWILMEKKLLAFYSPDNKWLTTKHMEYDLNSSDYTRFCCSFIFVCVYSNRFIQVLKWNMHMLDPVLEINVNEPIHVTFVEGKFLIICSRQGQLIEVWNCLSQTRIETFHFHAPLRHCTTVVFSRRIMRNIAVTKIELDSNDIYYLKLVEPLDPDSDQNRFKLFSGLKDKPGKRCVLWKSDVSIFYNDRQTFIHLHEFSRESITETFERIENLLPLTEAECVTFSKLFGTAVIWFSKDCAVILHTCGKYFTIPGVYHKVYMESYGQSGITDGICFYNRIESKFSFFQLKCSENEHQYRSLGHLQLDQTVQYCGWRSDTNVGLILYCILNKVEFHTYYITVLNELPNPTKSPLNCNAQIDDLKIFNNHVVTFDQTRTIIRVFRISPNQSFVIQFQSSNTVSQVTMISSHILLLDSDNIISIYSLDNSETSIFKTDRFRLNTIQIHALSSVFYIFDGATAELFVVNVRKPLQLEKKASFKFSCRNLVTSIRVDQSLLCILSEDQSNLAMWNTMTDTLSYTSLAFEKAGRIKQMYALSSAFIFASDDQYIYLDIENPEESMMTLTSSDLIATKNNFLALFDRKQKTLLIYDFATKQRGERHPEVSCDKLCFTDDGKYLFGVALKESILFMYDVGTGKRLEKLFIHNLSSACIGTANDVLVIHSNEQLLLYSIVGKGTALLNERNIEPEQCRLFEKSSWNECYDNVSWIHSLNSF